MPRESGRPAREQPSGGTAEQQTGRAAERQSGQPNGKNFEMLPYDKNISGFWLVSESPECFHYRNYKDCETQNF